MAAASEVDLEQYDAQQAAISAEQDSVPLIGAVEPLTNLESVYKNNPKFLSKIHAAVSDYPTFRRVRGDGSCFYRAYVFGILEWMSATLSNEASSEEEKAQVADVVKRVETSLDTLLAQGYEKFTMEEFHEYFLEEFTNVVSTKPSSEAIAEKFRDEGLAQYIVSYARYLTSSYLKTHEEEFAPFIPDGKSVDEFRRQEIEAMKKESEHLQIQCLTSFLGVGVRVAYLDQSDAGGEKMRTYDFPEGAKPRVHLLYRPGHYDVLNLKK